MLLAGDNDQHRAVERGDALRILELWGVFSNGEWDGKRACCTTASRPFDSPLRFGLQQGQQFVGRPELAFAEARWHNCFDSLQFFGRIGSNVDFRRGQITVPQPQGDFPDVLGCLQHDHCAGMAKDVGTDLFSVQR